MPNKDRFVVSLTPKLDDNSLYPCAAVMSKIAFAAFQLGVWLLLTIISDVLSVRLLYGLGSSEG